VKSPEIEREYRRILTAVTRWLREEGFQGRGSSLSRPALDGIFHCVTMQRGQVPMRVEGEPKTDDPVLAQAFGAPMASGFVPRLGVWASDMATAWACVRTWSPVEPPDRLNVSHCEIGHDVLDLESPSPVQWFVLGQDRELLFPRVVERVRQEVPRFFVHFRDRRAMLSYWEQHRKYPGWGGWPMSAAAAACAYAALGESERALLVLDQAIERARTEFPQKARWLEPRREALARRYGLGG
jgi:hypothetical protein